MPKTVVVINSECPARCFEYDSNALAAEARFREGIDTADINDTLEVACPHEDCEIRDEFYIKEVQGARFVRFGIFGHSCLLNTLDNSSKS